MQIKKYKNKNYKCGFRLHQTSTVATYQAMVNYFGDKWVDIYLEYCLDQNNKIIRYVMVKRNPKNEFEKFLWETYGIHGVDVVHLKQFIKIIK